VIVRVLVAADAPYGALAGAGAEAPAGGEEKDREASRVVAVVPAESDERESWKLKALGSRLLVGHCSGR